MPPAEDGGRAELAPLAWHSSRDGTSSSSLERGQISPESPGLESPASQRFLSRTARFLHILPLSFPPWLSFRAR